MSEPWQPRRPYRPSKPKLDRAAVEYSLPKPTKRSKRIADLRLALVLRLRAWPLLEFKRETVIEDYSEVRHWRVFLGPIGIIFEVQFRL